MSGEVLALTNGSKVFNVEQYAKHLAKMENCLVMAVWACSRENQDHEVKGLEFPDLRSNFTDEHREIFLDGQGFRPHENCQYAGFYSCAPGASMRAESKYIIAFFANLRRAG